MGGSTVKKIATVGAIFDPGSTLAAAIAAAPFLALKSAKKAKKKAEEAAKNQEQRHAQQIEDIKKEQDKSDKNASEVGTQAKTATRKTSKARRRSTILTSGLGVVGEPDTANKSLLGR